jgi:hypothetical protein
MREVADLVDRVGAGERTERIWHELEILALFDRCRSLHRAVLVLLSHDGFVHEAVMLGRPLFTDSLALAELAAVDEKRRGSEWTPALRAAGVDHRRVNDMRHTFATWAIEEGSAHLWQLAKIMGTSVAQLEDTYARWLRRTDERLVAAFDAYDAAVGVSS